jgi:serine/threonine-protein kinase
MLEFRTLGEITLRRSAEPPPASVSVQPKLVALLSYLLVAYPRGLHRRDTLLGLLWAEHDEQHARAALRQALHGLRRALGADVVITRGDADVAVDTERVWCDALAFEQALERRERRRAARLYCGPFLRGLHVPDAPDFDAWVESMRDRLGREYAAALEALAREAMEEGETLRAVEWWRQLWDVDPYSARVAMGLMEALE